MRSLTFSLNKLLSLVISGYSKSRPSLFPHSANNRPSYDEGMKRGLEFKSSDRAVSSSGLIVRRSSPATSMFPPPYAGAGDTAAAGIATATAGLIDKNFWISSF